jgi:hypothetical protein
MASPRDVTNETNARFWIMTSYKPGIALDPGDPADKRMARIWLDVYRDLVRQSERGTIALTHKHPELAERLNRAIRAYQIESTTRQSDPRYAEARARKAQALNEAGYWQAMITSRRPTVAAWPWYGGLYVVGLEG